MGASLADGDMVDVEMVIPDQAFKHAADVLMVAEIMLPGGGVRQSKYRSRYEGWFARNLPLAEIAPVTAHTSGLYADSRLWLKSRGTPIPSNDLWTAAMTLEHRLPPVQQ